VIKFRSHQQVCIHEYREAYIHHEEYSAVISLGLSLESQKSVALRITAFALHCNEEVVHCPVAAAIAHH